MSIYRSPHGRSEVLRLYDRAVEDLGVPVEEINLETRFGRTHVVVTGPEHGPPLLLLQGGNFLGPLTLAWLRPLAREFRIYAPDTVGHPGRSAETRPSPKDTSYGEWAVDVLDGLELCRVPLVGLSYGAGILLRLAVVAPERIDRAVLLMPAGIVSPPVLPLLRSIVLPMIAYKIAPGRDRLLRAVRPMFSGEPPEAWAEAIGAMFRHLKLERGMPRNATREELSGFHAPTLVLAGETDPFFPGHAVLRRAREVIPNLAAAELLEGERHLLSQQALAHVNARIRQFLGKERLLQ